MIPSEPTYNGPAAWPARKTHRSALQGRCSPGVGRSVIVAISAVVVSFVATLAFSVLRLEPIQDQSIAITLNGVPSLERLSDTRADLQRLGATVGANLLDLKPASSTRRDVETNRQRMKSGLAAYRSLPQFPGEQEGVAEVDRAVAALDDATEATVVEIEAASPLPVRIARYEAFTRALEQADAAMDQLETLNANGIRQQATRSMALVRGNRLVATTLGLASIALSAIAASLVVRSVRRQEALAAVHAELLATRAAELEAFAGRVAHDLRNPLGALAMRLWSVQRQAESLPEPLRKHLDNAGKQVERMNDLIEGLLEFARAGAHPPPGARADLEGILNEVVAEAHTAAHAAGADLRVDTPPHVELACTPAALISVLSNLLSNAVKFVVEGRDVHRRVAIHFFDRPESARIEVEDNGPGLPAGFEDRAFQPFVRHNETKQPGTGLGLATVKKIVEAYGGRVGVHSQPGEGSTFWFELPKAAASPPAASPP